MISLIVPALKGFESLNQEAIESYEETCIGEKLEVVLVESYDHYAVNVNRGFQQATGDILLVVNNDTIALPGWSSWLLDNADKGIVAFSNRADCGWAWGLSRSIQEQVGLLDEAFINSYEDRDYVIRAALAGYKIILADKPYLIHQGGHTINQTAWGPFEEQRPARIKQCQRNKDLIQAKYPGLNVDDLITSTYFAHYGPMILREWMNGKTSRQAK